MKTRVAVVVVVEYRVQHYSVIIRMVTNGLVWLSICPLTTNVRRSARAIGTRVTTNKPAAWSLSAKILGSLTQEDLAENCWWVLPKWKREMGYNYDCFKFELVTLMNRFVERTFIYSFVLVLHAEANRRSGTLRHEHG